MKPEVASGDIVNLAPYHFYMKTTADGSEDAFSGVTVPLDVDESDKVREAVIAQSRKRYSTPKAKVEKYMEELFTAEEPQKKSSAKAEAPKASGAPTKKRRYGA